MRARSRAGDRTVPLGGSADGAEAVRRCGPRSGYVLIEVAAALAITAMLMAVTLPVAGNGTTPARLIGLTTASVSLLREARIAALSRNVPVAATFDSARRMLRVGSQTLAIPTDVDFTLTAGGNCPTHGSRAQLLFRPDGTNCGGVLRFAKGRRIFRARVNWVDGRIDVAEGE